MCYCKPCKNNFKINLILIFSGMFGCDWLWVLSFQFGNGSIFGSKWIVFVSPWVLLSHHMVYMDHDMVPSQKGYYPSSTLSHCTVNYSLFFVVYLFSLQNESYLVYLPTSVTVVVFYFRGTVHFGPDSYFVYFKMNLNLRTNFPNFEYDQIQESYILYFKNQ